MAHWRLLPWDSEHFGWPVARIDPDRLDGAALERCLRELDAAGVRLAYWGAADDPALLGLAQSRGGRLVDRKRTYACELGAAAEGSAGEAAAGGPEIAPLPPGAAPTPALEELAIASGVHSRFALDPALPRERFEAMYRIWLRRSLAGELADAVLLSGTAAAPRGLVTVSRRGAAPERAAELGLLAVASSARRAGLGAGLVRAAQGWARARGCARLRVVTQGANEDACRLYLRCGFGLERQELWFHFHLGSRGECPSRS